MIFTPEIESYLETLQAPSDPLLAELETRAAEHDFPIIGPQVGSLLAMLTRMMGAERILELGSGFGYSAIWFARALPEKGQVHLTEFSKEFSEESKVYLERAGLQDKTRYHHGDGLQILAQVEGAFDIIFNDVDKEFYPQVVEPAVEKLNPGGLLITDNALWYGKPADPEVTDQATEGVRVYNRLVTTHADLDTVILPLRDGVAISRKRS